MLSWYRSDVKLPGTSPSNAWFNNRISTAMFDCIRWQRRDFVREVVDPGREGALTVSLRFFFLYRYRSLHPLAQLSW